MSSGSGVTLADLESVLLNDNQVKVAGVDADGMLRGKLVSKKKFVSIARDGFGFCSVIFGWDMHDQTYFKELAVSNKQNGYRDMVAIPDLSSFRRTPWEDYVPFCLVDFFDPDTNAPISPCPRGLLKTAAAGLEKMGCKAMAGGMGFFVVHILLLSSQKALLLIASLLLLRSYSGIRVLPVSGAVYFGWRGGQLFGHRDVSQKQPPSSTATPDGRHVWVQFDKARA